MKEILQNCDEGSFSVQKIKKEASERKKKQPLIQRIIRSLSKSDKPFREIIFSHELTENRVALLEDGILEKYEFEISGKRNAVGAIYRGKIQNLQPGLKAAFVDIGEEKNAFLHYWDIVPEVSEKAFEVTRRNSKKSNRQITLDDIPKIYPIGTDIMVQVIKAQIGTKGPRVTTNISLPGKCLVLMPFSDECGISKKIDGESERSRLRGIIDKLTIPDGMGVIIRTAGVGKKVRHFVRDLYMLLQEWQSVCKRYNNSQEPSVVHIEPDLAERTVRDFLTDDVDRIIVNDEDCFNKMVKLVSVVSPRSKQKFNLFTDSVPIFERFNVERQVEQTFRRRVPLSCGGEIVIHETEALTAVDVNTSNFKIHDGDNSKFIYDLNYEACKEIARQIRLRNIGGLIVVDFIDMLNKRDRSEIFFLMRNELSKDSARNFVLPISQLGLMEISRQRHSQSNSKEMCTTCQYCNGDGITKSPRTICNEIYRKISGFLQQKRVEVPLENCICIEVSVNNAVLDKMKLDEAILLKIEDRFNAKFVFHSDASLHVETYKISCSTK